MKEKVIAIVFLFMWLDLIFAQEVVIDPVTTTVGIGELTRARCFLVPETTADAQYHWFDKDGNEVLEILSSEPKYIREPRSPQTGMWLYIRVTDDDEGRYRCEVVLGKEKYEGYLQLDTFSPIKISNCDLQQSGTKGKEGKLSCTATAGNENLEVYWERNGYVLTLDTDPRYRFEGTAFVISNVTDADKGVYTYVAEPTKPNPYISLQRVDISFDVWTMPYIEKPVTSPHDAIDGHNATLFCSASGYPTVQFRWYRDKDQGSGPIKETGRIKMRRNNDQSQLVFDPITKDDEAHYTCEAHNAAGAAESSKLIVVNTPPKINELKNETVEENKGVTLTCDAYGDPRPRMEWVKGDSKTAISGDSADQVTVSDQDIGDVGNPGTRLLLQFKKVKYQDAGIYTCKAFNLGGNDKKIVNLEIIFAPKFDQQPDGPFYNWVGNADGYLPCVVSANPLPVFQWWKGDKEITSADSFFSFVREEHRNKPDHRESEKYTVTSKLMITANGNNDKTVYGDFRCEARNRLNVTKRVITMEPAKTPGKPIYSKSRELPRLLELQFLPQVVQGPEVLEYKAIVSEVASADPKPKTFSALAEWRDFVDDHPEPRTTLIIDGLEPAHTYSITMYAINAVGEGTFEEINYLTKSIQAPSQVEILSGINSNSPGSIVVMWVKPEDGGADILKYHVQYRQVSARNTTGPDGEYVFLSNVANQDWATKEVLPTVTRYTIRNLLSGAYYQVQVRAINNHGTSPENIKIIRTKLDPNYRRAIGGAPQAVSTIFTLVAALSTACIRSFL